MRAQRFSSPGSVDGQISRRTFVKGLAVGGAAAGLGLWGRRHWRGAIGRLPGPTSREPSSTCASVRRP